MTEMGRTPPSARHVVSPQNILAREMTVRIATIVLPACVAQTLPPPQKPYPSLCVPAVSLGPHAALPHGGLASAGRVNGLHPGMLSFSTICLPPSPADFAGSLQNVPEPLSNWHFGCPFSELPHVVIVPWND